MPPSSPWTTRSLPSHSPPLHRPHTPLSLRTRARLRLAVFVLAFLLTASTLYEVCFRQRVVAVEEGWKYRVGEQLKMGVERMRVEGVVIDREEGLKEGGGKERGGEGEVDGHEDGTLVGGGGGMGMYGEGMGGGNGRWIDEVGWEAESEGRLGLRPSSTVGMEGGATGEVVVEGQGITLAGVGEGLVVESKVEDDEIPVETTAVHAAESGLVGKPVESEPLTFRVVEPSIEAAPVTASDPPIQTPIKLRSEPVAYTVSFSLL